MEDCVKAEGNESIGKSLDVEAVLGVYLEEYQVAVEGWEYGLGVSISSLVKTNDSSLSSTDIGSDVEVKFKSIVVSYFGDVYHLLKVVPYLPFIHQHTLRFQTYQQGGSYLV